MIYKDTTQKTDWSTQNLLKTGFERMCSRSVSNYSFFLNRDKLWMKKIRQAEHIRGHLWHRYSVTVNQVMMATVQLSKCWLQLSHKTFIYVHPDICLYVYGSKCWLQLNHKTFMYADHKTYWYNMNSLAHPTDAPLGKVVSRSRKTWPVLKVLHLMCLKLF
jgi:hypothetical protein